MPARILLVDDEEVTLMAYSRYLSKVGYEVNTAATLSAARDVFGRHAFDILLLDLNLPDGNGLDWIAEVREKNPDMALVVITGGGDVTSAVEAMRLGADNFLEKPVNLGNLDVFLRKSLELESLRKSRSTSRRLKKKQQPFFITEPCLEPVLKLASVAAQNTAVVVITGETGTGKGVMARWIHENGDRRDAPFVEINCSALKGDLLANELFGHAKGAFTSAHEDRVGLIEAADGGTLFLDEIGDMDPVVQTQLLKTLEEKRYRRIGEVKERISDFRLICATNRNLQADVDEGKFRQDLFFRINLFPVHLPPLREFAACLPEMTAQFLIELGDGTVQLTPQAAAVLAGYRWPGNTRELRNMLERAMLLAQGAPLGPEHFPGMGAPSGQMPSVEPGRTGSSLMPDSIVPVPTVGGTSLDDAVRQHVLAVMEKHNGDTSKACKALGISRASLYRKLEKYRE